MEIEIISYISKSRKNQVLKAINILNSVQNYFYFKLTSDTESNIFQDDMIYWDDFSFEHHIPDNAHIIYLTEKPFDDNWFSHEEAQYAIITTHSWEKYFAPPSLKSYLIYQIAQAAINFETDLNERMAMNIVHESTEGCMFDLCTNKQDIKLGMIAGTICPTCKGTLRQYGVQENALTAIERILSTVRMEAIGHPLNIKANKAFIVMKFSENDENDHAYRFGIIPALKELGIKCVRADNTVQSRQLLEMIIENIEDSRFIIAKVDSKNLNVYFELGLAMGLEKDVLLISENELILDLPSDLRNWSCLTYGHGNYEVLRDNIIKFYKDNFHY